MRILVCVKQVIALEGPVRIAAPGAAIAVDEQTEFRMNEYDEYAVEAALRLRESTGGEVEVISLGPPRAAATIRRAMGMGADRGIHLLTKDEDLDAFAIAHCLAESARDRRYDLIVAGMQSEDAMQGAVGPMIAACLGRPCASGVVSIEPRGGDVEVTRELDGGRRERLALKMPAVITIQTSAEKPRYPSLSNMLRANRADLETVAVEYFGVPPARQRVVQMTYPEPTRACAMLEGTAVEKARRLRELLNERNVL